ncbi:hypothetical protein ONS95_001254 [Cadophora gregata]|uniref:uncharacterized protein n=1 Tax=Cadophora gregata TaxID=51156 RepID=UPI0026DC4574|nr:uncharacterized protein ONS95_001254 [Cadophora gregata]KAK0101937.1 hypothetical protein ONS96_005907 [Cadophora gregata f. sp. sojae]KAK0129323.1 hypothetical protein ONS95_001254 [Cadophora gregata]
MSSSLIKFLLVSVATLASARGVVFPRANDVSPATANSAGCAALSKVLSSKVFYADSPVYQYENSASEFWSNVQILAPLCVFRPQSSGDVATAISVLKKSCGSFAVRGGGHMGIAGANNIDNGVLMVMSNLTTMRLSSDKSILSVGPSWRWGEVYKYLEDYDLTVPGGRLAPVGVPGLLLAGGINFYGNQVGFSADNVVEYEVVLAAGNIVQASRDNNSDLFWALKGGSSNFGIVTRFDIKTIPSKKVWAGIYSVASAEVPALLAATAAYAANITDPLSHIVPATIATTRDPVEFIGAVILFYDSDTITYPDCFKPFFDIPSIASTMGFKTIAEFADETGTAVVPGINDIFAAGTIVGTTYDELLKGIELTNSIFYERLPLLYEQVPASQIAIIEIDWQPIGKLWMDASAATGGNALGLDPSKIYLAWAEVVEWIGSEYDEICLQWVTETTAIIKEATKKAGIYSSFDYMGDAASFQTDGFYKGYGAKNQAKLLKISRKYDPTRLFQTLMPGGFKIGA